MAPPKWWVDWVNAGREAERNQYAALDRKLPYNNQNRTSSRVITNGMRNNIGGTRAYGVPYDQPGINTIPRDSDWYEATWTASLAHAASPNNLRIQTIVDMAGDISITDESVLVYDRNELTITIIGADSAYPQLIHIFLVKGPNALVFTSGNANPSSGFRAAIDAAGANGMEVEYFQALSLTPKLENSVWTRNAKVFLDFKDKLNSLTIETEKAISQGRSAPHYYLVFASLGNAATSTTLYGLTKKAYHSRRRKVVP